MKLKKTVKTYTIACEYCGKIHVRNKYPSKKIPEYAYCNRICRAKSMGAEAKKMKELKKNCF